MISMVIFTSQKNVFLVKQGNTLQCQVLSVAEEARRAIVCLPIWLRLRLALYFVHNFGVLNDVTVGHF